MLKRKTRSTRLRSYASLWACFSFAECSQRSLMTLPIVQVGSKWELKMATYYSHSSTKDYKDKISGSGRTSLTCLRIRTSKTSFISIKAGDRCPTSFTLLKTTQIQRPHTKPLMDTHTTTRDISLRSRGTTLGMTGKLLAQTHTLSNGMVRNMTTGRQWLKTLCGSTLHLAYQDLTLAMATRWQLIQSQLKRKIQGHPGKKLSTVALLPLITAPITKKPSHRITSAMMLGTPTLQSQVALNGVTKTYTGICWKTRLTCTKTVTSTARLRALSSP